MSNSEETLGEKHLYLNKLSFELQQQEISDIDINQSDVDNLLKIDIACRNRNVDFILNVFKCEDMLYVSRAIKHSLWLIQDPQYENIINPLYLHNELLPYMLTEARNKLLLHIRLHLKEPSRNEKFFMYLVGIDLTSAMKWFPNCSAAFITSRLEQDIYRIPEKIFLRLLWVTMEPLRVYVKCFYWKKPMLEKAMFTLCIYGEEYFKILDSVESRQIPVFNAKYTKLVMLKCPHCFLNKFGRYGDFIDGPTFAKYIKKEDLESFMTKYAANKKVELLFSQGKRGCLFQLNKQGDLLRQLSQCDSNKEERVKVLLENFHDVNLLKAQKKYILQFIHSVLKKFKVHTFKRETWTVLNNIYMKIGVYDENKQHLVVCKKSIIIYHVLNDLEVPEKILSTFSIFESFKSEQKEFNSMEKKKMFVFIFNVAEKQLEASEDVLLHLERILMLLEDWGENWQNYPSIVSKINYFLESMKDDLHTLYSRNRIWRKILFNESLSINCNEGTCLNVLKHNPKLLLSHKDAVISMCLGNKPMKRFCTKLRMFWSESIGNDFKKELIMKFPSQPSKEIFTMVSLEEILKCICGTPQYSIQTNITEFPALSQFIAKNMYRARPKPSMQLVLSYYKQMYLYESLASIKSILHSTPAKQTIECIKLQEWPEFVQKLCVLQAFTKFDRADRSGLVWNIWVNTKYSSVRADIFKMSYNILRKFSKNDMNENKSYNTSIEDEWSFIKCLIESLTDEESRIVYILLSKIEKVPLVVRSQYCIISYKFLKQLPSRCNGQRLMNNIASKISYNKVLPSLELDFVAEIVHDTIISRLWSEKLDWTFMNMVFECVFVAHSSHEKKIEAFNKILLPVLDNAFKIWNIKTQGLFMVRYNMNGLLSKIVYSYKEMLQRNNSILLDLLIDNLEKNLPIKDNYVIITNFKLAAKYLKVLSRCEYSPKSLYENTTNELSKICIDMLCEDVQIYSTSIWRLFFESWQMMLNGFEIKRKLQYKVNNHILDLSKSLSPDLDIIFHILVLEHIYYINYGDEDKLGRKALRDRIAAHPSKEVRSQCSKLLITDGCSIPHRSYFYTMTH